MAAQQRIYEVLICSEISFLAYRKMRLPYISSNVDSSNNFLKHVVLKNTQNNIPIVKYVHKYMKNTEKITKANCLNMKLSLITKRMRIQVKLA